MEAGGSDMSFPYDALPPLRPISVNHDGLTPEQEWTKITDAAERRKVQNRNAQRKYRHNLKRRVEALERQHNLGTLFTSPKTPSSSELSTSPTTKIEIQNLGAKTPQETLPTSEFPKERSPSPQVQTMDLMDPSLSIQSFDSSIEPDWMSQNFLNTPISMESMSLPSPPSTHSHLSPAMCTKSPFDDDIDQSLLSTSMMSMSSLDSYIQHNNSIIEDMCSSGGSDDFDLSCRQHVHQRPGLPRRVTAPEPTLGRTTLHLAAMRGYLQIVHILLEKGIDINTRDSQGWTALHLATERGQEEVVKLLLDRGADLYARV